MTAAIKASLANLNTALESLEKSATEAQANQNKPARKGAGQSDLFAVPSSSESSDVDAKALASRLDGAIAKVEKLLREGE